MEARSSERVRTLVTRMARQDQACSRLMTVPGIGPIISSAMVAAIAAPRRTGHGDAARNDVTLR